jgi:uncharacterized protein
MQLLTHNQLKISRHTVALKHLPPSFQNLCIVQISDLHFYEHTDDAYYKRVLEAVHAQNPDIIVLTGDLIHYGPDHVFKAGGFLMQLRARLDKVAILGNHDYNDGALSYSVRRILRDTGFKLLVNSHEKYTKDNQDLFIAGLDDLWYGTPDIAQALDGIPETACTLMLIHNPLLFDPIALAYPGRVQLVLGGHTHAGHVYIPFLGPIYRKIFRMKFRYGFQEKQGTKLYVTSGVGSAAFYLKKRKIGFPRFRFNTYPEIACFVLNKL